MESTEILIEVDEGVATVTLNRPERLNALSQWMMGRLDCLWDEFDADDRVRVVILTGAGSGFCAGLDLKEAAMADRVKNRGNLNFSRQAAQHWIGRLRSCSKPTIAVVNGVAAGGGLALTLACDIRIASETARFTATYAKIGMPVLDGVGYLLPQIVGVSKALELLYTAEIIGAEEAQRIGLVSAVVPGDRLRQTAWDLAQRIANGPATSLSMSKHVVYNSLGKSYIEHMAHQRLAGLANSLWASEDIAEGSAAFRERRQPNFRKLAR